MNCNHTLVLCCVSRRACARPCRQPFCIGDEVVQWNGERLCDLSAQAVSELIANSRHEPQLEVVVSRSIQSHRSRLPLSCSSGSGGSSSSSRPPAAADQQQQLQSWQHPLSTSTSSSSSCSMFNQSIHQPNPHHHHHHPYHQHHHACSAAGITIRIPIVPYAFRTTTKLYNITCNPL